MIVLTFYLFVISNHMATILNINFTKDNIEYFQFFK